MDTFATSGFELSALLAPELAGTVTGAGQGANGDPRAPEPGAAPFSLVLAAAASGEPEAATLPAGGNFLPLFDSALATAQAAEPASAVSAQKFGLPPGLVPASTGPALADPDAPLLAAATAKAASAPLAIGGAAADGGTAVAPTPDESSGASAAAVASVPTDADSSKPGSTAADHLTQSIRNLVKQIEAGTPEPAGEAPAQRPGEPARVQPTAVREVLQPLVPEVSGQSSTIVAAAEHANAAAAMPLARALHRPEAAAGASESGAAAPAVNAMVTEPGAAQSVDAPKFTAELPAGDQARLPGALAERVHWMVDHKLGEARIKLNPPQLGAIDIRISLADDQTFVQFTASQAGAREIIESALPRLRDLLGAAGLELGGATVGGEAMSRGQTQALHNPLPELEALDVIEPLVRSARPADGRVDVYA